MSQTPELRREAQPDGSVRVHFGKPILFHTEPKTFVTLRSPTVADIWELGDPRNFLFNEAGQAVPYTDRELLVRWIGRLMVDHDVDMIGRDGDAALGLLIEGVVLDFFLNARKRLTSGSAPSPIAA